MIPHEIYELATALSDELSLDFDEAVGMAWRIHRALESAGIALSTREEA